MSGPYQRIFILAIAIVVIFTCLARFPADDGLRHVGLAFHGPASWGDVYPFSRFEEFKDYDPWFGYDLTLRKIAGILEKLPVSVLFLKFLLTKILMLAFSAAFFYLVLERSGLLKGIHDRETFTLGLMVAVVSLTFPFGRIMITRPFAFGTLFLIYSVSQKGIVRGFVSSALLTFFYPYLSWFYLVPVSLAHAVKGNKRFALGAITFLAFFLLQQPASFWGFQTALFNSDLVRRAIRMKIGEFHTTLTFLPFYVYLGTFLILYPKFSPQLRRLTYPNLLMLIYCLPALTYVRYFFDLILPLFFVSFGKEIRYVLGEPYRKLVSSWKSIIQSGISDLKSKVKIKPTQSGGALTAEPARSGLLIKSGIAITYLGILALMILLNFRQVASLKEFESGLSPVPEGSVVLASFNLQYQILYHRPDLQVIPSCEMGFPEPEISGEYISYFNEGMITQLSGKTGAKYLLECGDKYIYPQEGRSLRLLHKNKRVNIWEIVK